MVTQRPDPGEFRLEEIHLQQHQYGSDSLVEFQQLRRFPVFSQRPALSLLPFFYSFPDFASGKGLRLVHRQPALAGRRSCLLLRSSPQAAPVQRRCVRIDLSG